MKNSWYLGKKRDKIGTNMLITLGDRWQSRKLHKYRYIR